MSPLTKSLLSAAALTGLLAGCASYDYNGPYGYSYGYAQPYAYGYDYSPYYYDYRTYYPSYGPAWYGPSVGFDFRYRDRNRSYGSDRRYRSDRRRAGNSNSRFHGRNRGATRPQQTANRPLHDRASGSRARVPPAPAPQRAQGGHRGAAPAQTALRNQQQ